MKEFLCWQGLPYSELFYLCLPTMPQAQQWHGWRLTDGKHEFPTAKTEHFAACLQQHKGTFSRTLAITHKLNEFSESCLCALPVMLAPPHELSCRFDPAVSRTKGQRGICTSSTALERYMQIASTQPKMCDLACEKFALLLVALSV